MGVLGADDKIRTRDTHLGKVVVTVRTVLPVRCSTPQSGKSSGKSVWSIQFVYRSTITGALCARQRDAGLSLHDAADERTSGRSTPRPRAHSVIGATRSAINSHSSSEDITMNGPPSRNYRTQLFTHQYRPSKNAPTEPEYHDLAAQIIRTASQVFGLCQAPFSLTIRTSVIPACSMTLAATVASRSSRAYAAMR